MKKLLALLLIISAIFTINAVTDYSAQDCQGSLKPYPIPTKVYDHPDSLTPVFINHIGRHGSRYPASRASSYLIRMYLRKADTLHTITPQGKEFLKLVENVIKRADGRWGELDSLGMAEQRGIAHRMYANFPNLFKSGAINAISTYSPRAVMSMYSFTHELTMLSTGIDINTGEGKKYNTLLRFFDVDTAYIEYRKNSALKEAYDKFFIENCPTAPMRRLLGNKFEIDDKTLRELAINQYYIIAGLSAMQMKDEYARFISLKEYNQFWEIFNLRQYLQRTANVISIISATIAAPLVADIVFTADSVLTGKLPINAKLRFAHAETLMPLLSLLALPDCYYQSHDLNTIATHWRDFHVVPMASNLQIIYFRAPSGTIYVRGDLNETPIPLIPGNPAIYHTWDTLRKHLLQFTI